MAKIKYGAKHLLLVVETILMFTAIDAVIHTLSPDFGVPDYYFTHKILYGTLIGVIAYYFLKDTTPTKRAFLFSATVSTLLQLNYLYIGYALWFVGLFLVIHFIILFAITYFVFREAD